jgi:hypothetical protein
VRAHVGLSRLAEQYFPISPWRQLLGFLFQSFGFFGKALFKWFGLRETASFGLQGAGLGS